MKTHRVNIFEFIHKALRSMLYDTALSIQQADFSSEEEARTVLKKIQYSIDAFSNHAHHEDKFIIPLVQKHDPEITRIIEAEHGKDEALSHELENKMEAFQFAASDEIKLQIANELHYLFIEFTAFNLVHMNKEEQYLNQVLWKHYTDQELIDLNLDIVKSISPDEMMFSLTWMIKGVNTLQLIQLLSGNKQNMPSEKFEGLYKFAESAVAPSRWEKVNSALKSIPVMA